MRLIKVQHRHRDAGIPPVIFLALAIILFSSGSSEAVAGEKPPFQLSVKTRATALVDISGNQIQPLSCPGGQPAAVLIFTSVDCPIANAFAPEISRIAEAYGKQGVALTLVHVDPSLDAGEAARHAADYGLDRHTRIVIDRKHDLVNAVGATVTPQAVVVTGSGQVIYRGRINDLYADFGDKRAAPSEHNLRDALDALLAGKPVPIAATKTIGCIIEPL